MQLDPHIEDLIIAYLSGNISAEDNQMLKAWLSKDPANRTILRRCREIWITTQAERQATNYDWKAGFEKFCLRKEQQQQQTRSQRNYRLVKLLRYAALLVFAVSVAAVICYRQGSQSWEGQLADVEMKVPMGSTLSLRLPDGTQVSLNGGSTLSYPQSFGLKDRKVNLTGEAYFCT